MSHQRTVSLNSGLEPGSETEKRETGAFFFKYISRRAENDQEMAESNTKVIKEQSEQAVEELQVEGEVDATAAIKVASKLADLG